MDILTKLEEFEYPAFFGFLCQFSISRTFWSYVYLSIFNFPHFLTGKQKIKKVREIQIIQIL